MIGKRALLENTVPMTAPVHGPGKVIEDQTMVTVISESHAPDGSDVCYRVRADHGAEAVVFPEELSFQD